MLLLSKPTFTGCQTFQLCHFCKSSIEPFNDVWICRNCEGRFHAECGSEQLECNACRRLKQELKPREVCSVLPIVPEFVEVTARGKQGTRYGIFLPLLFFAVMLWLGVHAFTSPQPHDLGVSTAIHP